MGIYTSGEIFGIRIYTFNDDDFSKTLFEEKYDEIMSHQQMREAYLFYNQLNDKNNVFFKIYIECSTTYEVHNKETYMMWHTMSTNMFLEKFGI